MASTKLAPAATSGLAAMLPERLLGAAIRRAYPRVEPELARLTEFVPSGGTAVDVGAWYGPWTARLLRRAERVVAVEPTAALAGQLRSAFPTVEVVEAAISDHAGEATLYLPEGGAIVGTSSLEDPTQGVPVSVRRITLDSLDLTDVRFVKLDIEGHELPALRGAAQTVQRDRPVLLVEVEERIQPVEPLLDLLTGWGYRGYVLPGREWVPLADFDLGGHQREAIVRVGQSFARRVVWPRPRYVNSVLFRPE
ncbi:FkbM family methyltransferase [Micromonospora zingiberis]|uniref:FkbM family methyltransferase n=1 Tax=Micromonospora zingiberis TaxID=2053011 RepID=A0A4R0GT68_9ACTN|nr:FkbM family methyltransferase [Micromonospora zingiberis]TCB98861.1 FkbM family methyltransferase [Micromonospora zingiberis]